MKLSKRIRKSMVDEARQAYADILEETKETNDG